ncbi:unnamed protein product [Rotaria magnacalcarata]
MDELTDTFKILNTNDWCSKEAGVISYIKTPIQNFVFTNNSDEIGKTLRHAIIYFAETLNEADRSSCILGNEFHSTRTHKYKLPRSSDGKTLETVTTMEVTTFAPIAFEYMRSMIGITPNDFYSSFSNDEFMNFANTGRSGSQMYKTYDDVYIIKTLRDHEAKYLIRILPGLCMRYTHTSSLMTRYVGLYSVNIRSTFSSEIYCVVMLNNLPSALNVHEIYDLKGSSVGRYSSINLPAKRLKSLKDLDFESFYPYGICIPHNIYQRLRLTLESDIYELRKLMITDFSLMLGIHQLDEYTEHEEPPGKIPKPKPQLGISAFFAPISIDRNNIESSDHDKTNKTLKCANAKSIEKFIMKPLHLIACAHEDTFNDKKIADSASGIPGVTHDGRRVLLYPALIDCLQTYDNFKSMQHTMQNLLDPKRGSEYSVIHPDAYEKRLIRFLFDKVFIDSNRSENGIKKQYHNQNEYLNAPHESFEIIQILNNDSATISLIKILVLFSILILVNIKSFQ